MSVREFLERTIDSDENEPVGIGGFTTMARITETVEHTAQAPVTYLENGEPANDHIIIDPILITIEGEVSKTYISRPPSSIIRDRIAATIGQFNQFLPERTGTEIQKIARLADQASERIRQLDSIIDGQVDFSRLLGNQDISAQDNRIRFIEYIKNLQKTRQLISIEMEARTFTNMYVVLFSDTKGNQNDSLKFKIKALEFRFVETFFSEVSAFKFKPSEGLGGQVEEKADKGIQKGKEQPRSILSFIFG